MKSYLVIIILFLILAGMLTAAGMYNILPANEYTVGISISDLDTKWHNSLVDDYKKRAESHDINVLVFDADGDVLAQNEHIKELVELSVDLIIIDAIDISLSKQLENAPLVAKIPVIYVDTPPEELSPDTYFVGCSQTELGKSLSEFLDEKAIFGEKAVILTQCPEEYAIINANMQEGLAKSGINVIETFDYVTTRLAADEITESLIRKYGLGISKIQYIFAESYDVAKGAHDAISRYNPYYNVEIYTISKNENSINEVLSGDFAGVLYKDPEIHSQKLFEVSSNILFSNVPYYQNLFISPLIIN